MNGKKLKAARKARGLTQTEAAEGIGVHQSQWCSWERGSSPRIETCKKIARLLRVSLESLL